MKCICISCFDYYEMRIKDIISFFKEKEYDVRYLFADYNHFSKKYEKREYRDGTPIHVPQYIKNISIARLNSHRVFAKKIGRIIEKESPDIIYCIFPPNLLCRKLILYKKTHSKTKIIFDCYDKWPESFPIGSWKRYMVVPFFIWKNLRDKYLKEADLILAPSNTMVRFLKKHIGEAKTPVQVFYPTLKETIRPKYIFSKGEQISFCYLGNVNHIMDMDLLISLFSILSKKIRVCVHIIGRGTNYDEFVDKLKVIGVNVVEHGLIFDMNEKSKVFEQCDLGINSPRKEISASMALKSIEYMRAGLPFINSGIGDNREMVKKEKIGININTENLEATAERILNLTHDDLVNMHERCISCYQRKFLNQDLNLLLKKIL